MLRRGAERLDSYGDLTVRSSRHVAINLADQRTTSRMPEGGDARLDFSTTDRTRNHVRKRKAKPSAIGGGR